MRFSLIDPVSLENIETQWIPEIRIHCQDAKYVLVGLDQLHGQIFAEREKLKEEYGINCH